MASSEAAETKTIITGLLISSPLRCTIQQLCRDFLNTVGYKIPFQALGFRSVEDYLRSIPDTVQVFGSGLSAEVAAVITSKSAHINELVAKQKKSSIPSHKKRHIKQFRSHYQLLNSRYRYYAPSYPNAPRHIPPRFQPSIGYNNQSENKPVIEQNPSSSSNYSGNSSISEQNSNSNYPVRSSLNEQNSSYPGNCNYNELNVRPPSSSTSCSSEVQLQGSSSSSSHSCKEKHEECDEKREKDCVAESAASSDYDDYESKVPRSIQNNLKKLILKFPNGLDCSKVPTEYQKMFGKKIHYEKYSYRSLIEMCSDLPEIFQYVQATSDEFILFDKTKPIPCLNQNDVATGCLERNEYIGGDILSELPKVDWTTSINFIPPDVLHLSDRIPRYFPKDLKEGDYLDISVGEIYDISKFWIYMTFGDLTPLMAELQAFFDNQRNKYLIPEFLLNEGLYCITLYAGQYHRSVIVNLIPALPNFVRVLFVDYGTVGNVPSKEIWFLPKQFGRVPCQAIRTRLSNIYPPYENRTWSVQAVNRFKKLVTDVALVGEVTRIDEDDHVLEIYLADITDENNIFYINDVLVEDGHALYVGQEQKKSLVDPNCCPVVKYIHLYPEFSELESGNAPTSLEMDYLVRNKIPLHHYMPHYFEIYYNEEIECIEQQHEVFNKEKPPLKIDFVSDEFDYGKDFDFSLFPEEMQDELHDLVNQEVTKIKTDQKKETVLDKPEVTSIKTNVKKETVVSFKIPQKPVETTTDDSVREYCCNKKRILELKSGGSEKNSKDSSSDLSGSLEVSDVPLNNTLQNLTLSNSDLSVINNMSNSTNPFLSSDDDLVDSNPFRRTNPFLSGLEKTINNKELFEIYGKPLEKKMNNLNTSNASPSKINKTANVDNSGTCSSTSLPNISGVGQRVRTPPGFNSALPQNTPAWESNFVNSAYFNGFYNNPYYQRYPQYNDMYGFNMNQVFMPPYFPNQFQFNLQFFHQFAQNLRAQAPSGNNPPMCFRPPFKKN